ncbi:MAG: 16S rRNA (uracil(1498)-N(3))-methyltransferase [Pseudomonadota bacterium]|nr:16S rRNA (uracil(1498)-N(3))-methyltransferase [Pseudomonadota bacterium]
MIRLFVPDDLGVDAEVVPTPDQARYLTVVMRLGAGDEVLLFNGRDGEWRARLALGTRRECRLLSVAPARPQAIGPDLDLVVALVKRPRLETIVEKAAELGARRVAPTVTERTSPGRANLGRLTAIAVEAAEQTGRLDVPEVLPPRTLAKVLADWRPERRLMFCDEGGEAPPALDALAGAAGGPWAILIGPEGGFSPAERARVRALAAAVPVSLGPRILRADTAAIAAMTLWQACLGDGRA